MTQSAHTSEFHQPTILPYPFLTCPYFYTIELDLIEIRLVF